MGEEYDSNPMNTHSTGQRAHRYRLSARVVGVITTHFLGAPSKGTSLWGHPGLRTPGRLRGRRKLGETQAFPRTYTGAGISSTLPCACAMSTKHTPRAVRIKCVPARARRVFCSTFVGLRMWKSIMVVVCGAAAPLPPATAPTLSPALACASPEHPHLVPSLAPSLPASPWF